MYGADGWHMGGMMIWWILLVVVAIAMIWFVFNRSGGERGGNGQSPEQTLKRRFARGEIDRETYDQMLTDLRK